MSDALNAFFFFPFFLFLESFSDNLSSSSDSRSISSNRDGSILSISPDDDDEEEDELSDSASSSPAVPSAWPVGSISIVCSPLGLAEGREGKVHLDSWYAHISRTMLYSYQLGKA